MARDSWHIPFVFTAERQPTSSEAVHVVFLQRMSDTECEQVLQSLRNTDEDFARQLEVAQPPAPRRLEVKKWIRDYSPGSAAVLEIAKAMLEKRSYTDKCFDSVIFVDSGWEMDNVIAAHWEKAAEGAEAKLMAARVPMGVANVLLTACVAVEGMTLARGLGLDAFEASKVDFYKDLRQDEQPAPEKEHPWPSHLPRDLKLKEDHPVIISLRHLDDKTMPAFEKAVNEDAEEGDPKVEILNWEGPEPTDRLIIRDLFDHMYRRSPEQDQKMLAFFVDYMLQGPNGQPQILAVGKTKRLEGGGVQVLPVFTPEFLIAYEKTCKERDIEENQEIVDIWKKEHVTSISKLPPSNDFAACPIFFLRPFTKEEERKARAAVCALGDVEHGEDWGHNFIWCGYPFEDDEPHTLEDLKNLFERCDPFSPAYDPKNPGPYRLDTYPDSFAALDDKVFDPEQPKAWMGGSLDFHGEDVADQLGWLIGTLDAKEISIIHTNWGIANMGPSECLDEETQEDLWLSDLKAYREEDWDQERLY